MPLMVTLPLLGFATRPNNQSLAWQPTNLKVFSQLSNLEGKILILSDKRFV